MSASATIVWFRLDLRIEDNPALIAAVKRGGPIIPVFIFAPEEESPWVPGGASQWWLHHSLASLDDGLRGMGSRIVLRIGQSVEQLHLLLRETNARAVYWNRRYEPAIRKRDEAVETSLRQTGVEVEDFNSALLHEPWTIRNKSGKPFQVFTPFWRTCLDQPDPSSPLARPRCLPCPKKWPRSDPLQALSLIPRLNWTKGIAGSWAPGEPSANKQLRAFVGSAIGDYDESRDIPGEPGTSRLSPHLHFGEISPRQVWRYVKEASPNGSSARQTELCLPAGARACSSKTSSWRDSRFLAELGWREFSHHLLYHFPDMDHEPIRKEFRAFRWRKSPELLKAWQQGRTGYPLVDAGMRELWHTGWMHNRVRMVAASFLVKHLLCHWHKGAKWFWDTLVDADLAQNSMGWQWVAGCGADAAPFFRIFNPALQGEKFDPTGTYVRRWIPELAQMPDKWIHTPSKAPSQVLQTAGVRLGFTYPEPVVSHGIAREIAMEAYNSM